MSAFWDETDFGHNTVEPSTIAPRYKRARVVFLDEPGPVGARDWSEVAERENVAGE